MIICGLYSQWAHILCSVDSGRQTSSQGSFIRSNSNEPLRGGRDLEGCPASSRDRAAAAVSILTTDREQQPQPTHDTIVSFRRYSILTFVYRSYYRKSCEMVKCPQMVLQRYPSMEMKHTSLSMSYLNCKAAAGFLPEELPPHLRCGSIGKPLETPVNYNALWMDFPVKHG